EELVRETQRVLHPYRVAEALGEALLAAFGAAVQLGVEGLGLVQFLGAADPEGKRGRCGHRTLPQHQVVVDELLEGAQVDGLVVLLGDHQAEDIVVEGAGGSQVGDHQFHRRTPQDVRWWAGGAGDRRLCGMCTHVSVLANGSWGLACRRGGPVSGVAVEGAVRSVAVDGVLLSGVVAAAPGWSVAHPGAAAPWEIGHCLPNTGLCTSPRLTCTACWSV